MDGESISAVLEYNAAARDFPTMLPLTLIMVDYNGAEKIGNLPRRLSTQDVPDGFQPTVGDCPRSRQSSSKLEQFNFEIMYAQDTMFYRSSFTPEAVAIRRKCTSASLGIRGCKLALLANTHSICGYSGVAAEPRFARLLRVFLK